MGDEEAKLVYGDSGSADQKWAEELGLEFGLLAEEASELIGLQLKSGMSILSIS